MFEGHVKSSLVGDSEDQDDVTTGRNLVLHLNKGDQVKNLSCDFSYKTQKLEPTRCQVDVGLDKVMPNGAGLTHSSFCVAEIARSKLNCNCISPSSLSNLYYHCSHIFLWVQVRSWKQERSVYIRQIPYKKQWVRE